MINLLPPQEKEKILLERKKRVVLNLLILILFFFLCLILALVPIKIYLRSQVKSQEFFLAEIQKETGQTEIKDLRKKIDLINSTLTNLDNFYKNKVYFSEILEKISEILPEKIYLNTLSITFSSAEKKEERVINVSFSGFAPNREVLFEFKEILEKETNFEKIFFPPENWVKRTNINFTVSFEIPQ